MAARVLPADIIVIIDSISENFKKEDESGRPVANWVGASPEAQGTEITAIIDLVEQLDQIQLPSSSDRTVDLIIGIGAMKNAMERWKLSTNANDRNGVRVEPTNQRGGLNPISLVRRALRSVPVHAIPDTVDSLLFVKDEALRESLRHDIAHVDRLLQDEAWKAACVIAGSAVEALLLDRILSKVELADQVATDFTKSSDKSEKRTGSNYMKNGPTGIHMKDYLLITRKMGEIDDATLNMGSALRDFRNLIHPGREKRLKMTAGKAEAVSSFAVLLRVIEELKSQT